jgi:hypothetical protein
MIWNRVLGLLFIAISISVFYNEGAGSVVGAVILLCGISCFFIQDIIGTDLVLAADANLNYTDAMDNPVFLTISPNGH